MKMNRTKTARRYFAAILLAALSLAGMFAQAQAGPPVKGKPEQKSATAASAKTGTPAKPQDPGERKFQENCRRCHDAPEQISPRIAGTVVRHMRVRASLSAKDERDILRYLAP